MFYLVEFLYPCLLHLGLLLSIHELVGTVIALVGCITGASINDFTGGMYSTTDVSIHDFAAG